jgi:multidrug efflux system membrane fusion protein
LTETQAVVGRYEPLVKINAVSQQDFDTAIAALRSAKAARQSAGAEVETAKLNLEYATVRATISGRIGRAKVTEGALVGLNEATPMAIIQQLNPVYVDFRQSATSALRMRESLEKGKVTRNVSAGVPITLNVDGTSKTRAGKLLFSDVTVDSNTGEILMRGQFDNADNLLLPGMYVRGQVNEGIDSEAILVPQRAVQRRSDGKAQVLVVGKDSVVEAIDVQTGSMKGSEWHIINGLQPGTKVIVGGSAVPGTKVTTTDSSSTKARG